MKIVRVNNNNKHVYANLYQGYAAEFSKIIEDKPDENGLFDIYPKVEGNVSGYLLYVDDRPAALTAIMEKSAKEYEICDFYVLPCFRKNKIGKHFIIEIFELLGGAWEIKQVEGADHAVKFWQNVVSDYTVNSYIEDKYLDEKWGLVTRQRFSHTKGN
ncbi:hypothetical protein PVK62_02255 [Aliivibrio sp. S3MY1]|uniref:GNAT family N-acetyltransferase n=1 Tax=unclassified Aliivibrio TaxID=2645654 RepID=UPI00237851E6|nr:MULTISPECIES: hypothetical protein [unclassified Aliivibrio]MDD9194656.1 hypothetical protein [Aliivibrio sp. S3MY1]MDD9198504.1 hypothetical protein [Aliivibrio sp. S2MY1]